MNSSDRDGQPSEEADSTGKQNDGTEQDSDRSSSGQAASLSRSVPTDMPEGHFTQIEFSRDGAGNAFFSNALDPNLTYDFVRMLQERIEGGFTETATLNFESDKYIDTDERRTNAEIYAKAEVLRGTMQYVEQFGIYLESYLRNDRPLASSLIETNVTHFYQSCEESGENVEHYLAQCGVSESYEDRLQTVFGYQALLDSFPAENAQSEHTAPSTEQEGIDSTTRRTDASSSQAGDPDADGPDGGDDAPEADGTTQQFTRAEAEHIVAVSTETIRSRIEVIARFYLEFRDLYNAIKHGTRVVPQNEFTLDYGLADEPISVNEQYVFALCKTSGKRDTGRPYFLYYPADRLASRSARLLELTHELFSYLRDRQRADANEGNEQLSTVRIFAPEARVEDDEVLQRVLGSRTTPSLNSETAESDGQDSESETSNTQTALESGDYVQISNPDLKAFVPRFNVTSSPSAPTIAARFELTGRTITIVTERDTDTSVEYPLTVSLQSQPGPSAKLSLVHKLDITTDWQPLDFAQYEALLRINEMGADSIEYIEFDIVNGDTITEPFAPNEWSLDVGPETRLDRELVSFVARLGLITQQRIPIPGTITEDHLDILQSEHGTVDTRADAQSVLDRIEASSEEITRTHVDIEYDGERRNITHLTGALGLSFTQPDGETVTLEDLLDGERGPASIRYVGIPGTPEWFVEHIQVNPEVVKDVIAGTVPGDAESEELFAVTIDIDLHVQTLWYDENRVVFRPEQYAEDTQNEAVPADSNE